MDCPGCNKPMIEGQVFNGLLKCHWDCQDVVREKMGAQNAEDLINLRVKARLAQDGIFPGHPLYERLMGAL